MNKIVTIVAGVVGLIVLGIICVMAWRWFKGESTDVTGGSGGKPESGSGGKEEKKDK